jgi:hypothetical protein
MLTWKKPEARIKRVNEGIMEMNKRVVISFNFRPDPQIPLFLSMYAFINVLVMRKKRRRIRSRFIFSKIRTSLFSSTGRNFLKKGSCVST